MGESRDLGNADAVSSLAKDAKRSLTKRLVHGILVTLFLPFYAVWSAMKFVAGAAGRLGRWWIGAVSRLIDFVLAPLRWLLAVAVQCTRAILAAVTWPIRLAGRVMRAVGRGIVRVCRFVVSMLGLVIAPFMWIAMRIAHGVVAVGRLLLSPFLFVWSVIILPFRMAAWALGVVVSALAVPLRMCKTSLQWLVASGVAVALASIRVAQSIALLAWRVLLAPLRIAWKMLRTIVLACGRVGSAVVGSLRWMASRIGLLARRFGRAMSGVLMAIARRCAVVTAGLRRALRMIVRCFGVALRSIGQLIADAWSAAQPIARWCGRWVWRIISFPFWVVFKVLRSVGRKARAA